MSRWLVALRLARRDALRNRGRTLLILLMIAIPVTCAVAADTLLRTPEERPDQHRIVGLGNADARIADQQGSAHRAVFQDPAGIGFGQEETVVATPDVAAVLASLPPGSRLAEVTRGVAAITAGPEQLRVRAMAVEAADPLVAHLVVTQTGRTPANRGEIAVSETLARAGLPLDGVATSATGEALRVVGVFRQLPSFVGVDLVGLPGALSFEQQSSTRRDFGYIDAPTREWFVDSPADVTWDDVQELNRIGLFAFSRAVLANPPDATDPRFGPTGSTQTRQDVAIVGLIAAITLLQVVLLAGPAFAVGARRQRTALAQLAIVGGEPRDARRVVIAGGLVIGGAAAVLGVLLGLGTTAAVLVVLRGFNLAEERRELSVRNLGVIALFAVLSALLAALLPARSAGRQSPLAVLTDRRDPPRAGRTPLVAAVLLLAAGVAAAISAANDGDEVSVALAGVPTVLGAVLLAPAAIGVLGSMARALPLPLRFAARDAGRNRARTAPAMGAVIAVVAGAVALGTGAASDAAESRAATRDVRNVGSLTISAHEGLAQHHWPRIASAVDRVLPNQPLTEQRGVLANSSGARVTVSLCAAGASATGQVCSTPLVNGYMMQHGSPLLVGESGLDVAAAYGTADELARARRVLGAGGLVAFTDKPLTLNEAVLRMHRFDSENDAEPALTDHAVPASGIAVGDATAPALGLISEPLAERLGLQISTTALTAAGPIDEATELVIREAVSLRAPEAQVMVARHHAGADLEVVALLVLGGLAGVLVLGGTLTATQLALSDARPDFVTLHGVGAAPRTRRRISAAYASLIALGGATLGAAAGLVPGIAVAFPLTQVNGRGPYIALPWPLIAGLIFGVPLLAAGVAAATTRSGLRQGHRGVGT